MTLFCFQTVHLTGLTSVSLAKLLLNYFFSALLPPDSDQKMIPLAACRLVHFFYTQLSARNSKVQTEK